MNIEIPKGLLEKKSPVQIGFPEFGANFRVNFNSFYNYGIIKL